MKLLNKFFRTFTVTAVALSLVACDFNTEEVAPEVTLSEIELDGLAFMREEEKLARDVYLELFSQYDIQIFNNISRSEQTHMDLVLEILNKYGVEDPALSEEGSFVNIDLQKLYDDLVAQGSDSQEAALIVGATIEDLDIRDLEAFMAELENPDLVQLYDLLLCGSRNHLRAFTDQLAVLGATYEPQFITQEAYDAILAGDHEKCGQM